jgi:hypothetical protein
MKFVLMLWLSHAFLTGGAIDGSGEMLSGPVELPGDYLSDEECRVAAEKTIVPAVAKSIGSDDKTMYHWFCMPVHHAILTEGKL